MRTDNAYAAVCSPEIAPADLPSLPPSYPVPAVIAATRRVFVEHGLALRGELRGCDHLRIAGHIESDVALHLLDILDEGSFKGVAAVDRAYIAGRYEGTLTVAETLFVGPAARISGSVQCGKLELIEGGKIDGELRVLSDEAEKGKAAGDDADIEALQLEASPGSEADADVDEDVVEASDATPAAAPVDAVLLSSAAAVEDRMCVFDEAEGMFKTVLDRHPKNLGALAGLGHLARRRGDREAMHQYYMAALALDPMNIALRVGVARAFKEQGDVALARQILETVLTERGASQAI